MCYNSCFSCQWIIKMIKVGGSKIDIYGIRYRQIPPNVGLEEFVR